MTIDEQELGRRLKAAREACGLTQADTASAIGLSRPAIVQIEAGQRGVGALELERLAVLFGRDTRSFFRADANEQAALPVLLRASPDLEANPATRDALTRAVQVGREIATLEELLGLARTLASPPLSAAGPPLNKGMAIEQARSMADAERRRLALGDGPIGDLAEVLELQGVRVTELALPQEISGLSLADPAAGLLVVLNADHAVVRKQFSLAHEYAHVLFDRTLAGVVSRAGETDTLLEVRANAFAGSFLVPDAALLRLLAGVGRGGESRQVTVVPTSSEGDAGALRVETRPRLSQAIQLTDIAHVAHVFAVSAHTALYRLRNLRPSVMNDREFDEMKTRVDDGEATKLARALRMREPAPAPAAQVQNASHRLATLALDALRAGLITRARFEEHARLAGMDTAGIVALLASAGIETEAVPATRPGRAR